MIIIKKSFFVSIVLLFSVEVYCQDKDVEARSYYINAEEYFNRGSWASYDSCITQLEKAEKTLGTTNPKILYLKIKAMSQFINKYVGYCVYYDFNRSLNKFFEITDSRNYPENKYAEIVGINNLFQTNLKNSENKELQDSAYRILEIPNSKLSDSALWHRAKLVMGSNPEWQQVKEEQKRTKTWASESAISIKEHGRWFKYAFDLYNQLYNERKDSNAAFNIAECFSNGYGTDKSLTMAASYYMISTNRGNREAMLILGRIYKEQNNFNKSMIFYTKALKLDSSYSLYHLGDLYESEVRQGRSSNGTYKDFHPVVIDFYTRAANMGYRQAMEALAKLYEYGDNKFKKDKKLAAEWKQKAIDAPDSPDY